MRLFLIFAMLTCVGLVFLFIRKANRQQLTHAQEMQRLTALKMEWEIKNSSGHRKLLLGEKKLEVTSNRITIQLYKMLLEIIDENLVDLDGNSD